jgi:hypothetical protein
MVKPMSFNRRGGPDRRHDRPRDDRPRDDRPRDDRPRDDRPREARPYDRPRDPRPYQPRGGGGDRPYAARPRFDRPPDEGAMSIRLDPRRVNALKHMAAEAGVRPGDLVRQWVEERIDGARTGTAGVSLADALAELTTRVAALEAASGQEHAPQTAAASAATAPPGQDAADSAPETPADQGPPAAPIEAATSEPDSEPAPKKRRTRKNAVAARPSSERIALHDEVIAIIRDRGPMTAGELAAAIVERGRYTPPRSGKPLDAAMVSQRVSNPNYRSRFIRDSGRIGLAEGA